MGSLLISVSTVFLLCGVPRLARQLGWEVGPDWAACSFA